MTTPTHIISYILISNLFGIPLKVPQLAFGLLGTIVPDISNPYGGIGKILKPVSGFIFQKWGHRSITHSWVMVTATATVAVILKVVFDSNIPYLLLLGVASHIALDMINISGVKFFYPDSLVVVMPAEHDTRIGTGSKREKRFAFAVAVLAMITVPLGVWGYESTIRFLAGSHTAATEEYKKYIDQYEIFVEVTRGINRISQSPVAGQRFRVVAALPKKLTLVETEKGKRVTIGQTEEAIIETKRMRVYKGVPIQVQVVDVDISAGWDKLIEELESPYSYAIGTVSLTEHPEFRPELDQWEGITVKGNVVSMEYSSLSAIRKLIQYRPVEGKVKVRKEVSTEGILAPLQVEEKKISNTFSFLIDIPYEGLQIKEGQMIQKGQVIGIHPEANKVRADVETLKASLKARETDIEKEDTLLDKSLSIKREIDKLDIAIAVQEKVVNKSQGDFKEAEKARLDKLKKDRDNLQSELAEVQRSIKEQKDYIEKKNAAMVEETKKMIEAMKYKESAYIRKAPVSGKVVKINQKGGNLFEITVVL